VRIDGTPRQRLEAGDYFGEIALLRDVPRTATVVAVTELELLSVEREAFIGAVTGQPESAEAAHSVIASRLGGIRPGVASA
jgi:CRP-like cAMP-binding protein